MVYENKIIQKAIDDGYTFIVLHPVEIFEDSIKEFNEKEGRLVYNVDKLLDCLRNAYGWDPVMTLEWFEYNIFDLTFVRGGPIFYDEFEEKYLTI